MKETHHSEYLKLNSVFIKPAANAFVSNELLEKQWNELNYLSQPDFNEALAEYESFEAILSNNGVEMLHFPKDHAVTIDSIYCRDAAIATDYGMIICNMGKWDRRNEPNSQKQTYLEKKIPILGEIEAPGTLEGGDVAWLDKRTLAVGLTYRTNSAWISQLKGLLEPKGITVLVAEMPHYKGPEDVFHLMSVLSPVDKDLAVVYSPLMPISFRNELLERGIHLVEVPDDEFEAMGCNVLALAPRKCVMVEGNPKTTQALLDAGCEVMLYKGEHISVKGGGGPTCLTRPLLRSF
ncbi:arginine deiminase family protein [Aureisphaera galaxeae]|uniref:dimethylarginine dimethylaminohydrolase family protein n=1 Tax=Aureisphaera galaxeae TaxID=1538023 RepID=UPI0023502990|nr:arginine deiminase family protein [Aureisphaera galaxeae]MDC8002820.1 arginine deiminase family protein [Aureisphaera galaxeae]